MSQQRERQVAIQVTLVELVEDDGTDAVEERVGQELASENAFGQEAETGPSAEPSFESDLVADLFSESASPVRRRFSRRSTAPPRVRGCSTTTDG